MQYRAGRHRHAACPAVLEAEAYTVQAAYLRQQRVTDPAIALMAGLMSGCPGEAQY